ncbi:hypothetical protein TSA6c_16970 [Azospirillum sp. TSA6c]|nr:hypothetical protein TSA6c_16970 [Azospirillum sp. TSA6c]
MVDAKAEMATSVSAAASQQQQASASATATAADRQAVAIDRAAVATDRSTTQNLVTQAQSSQTASAASAVLAQQFIGTATNTIVPAINYRLASAWDANGQPTAYALSGVAAVHRYDTRLDWDRGAWRKGRLARQASWYNESLNTATRGAKKEFPVVALVVTCATRVIIYDLHDLDANASPRMWMVFLMDGTRGYRGSGNSNSSAAMRGGYLVIGDNNASFGGLYLHDFTRDRSWMYDQSNLVRFPDPIASRNVGYSSLPAVSGGILSRAISGVDVRVLPGAPLDPVTRLPVPTIAVATAGGTSVIHPTGLIATITRASGHNSVRITPDNRLWLGAAGADAFDVGPIPYATAANTAWRSVYYDQGTSGLKIVTGGGKNLLAGGAVAGSGGLTMLAEDAANPANGMVSYVTKDFATGWLPGDTRQCAITEGAGSNGASGGELVANGTNLTNTAGWSQRNAATLSAVNGALRVTATSSTSGQGGTYSLATTAGVQHTVSFDVVGGGNPTAYYYVDVTDSAEATVLSPTATAAANGVAGIRISFVATGSVSKLRLFTTSTSGQYVDYANISCRKTGTFSDAVTGSGELIVNGDGSSAVGWTGANATPSVSGGYLCNTASAAGGVISESIPTIPGQTYLLAGTYMAGTSSAARVIAVGASTVEVNTAATTATPYQLQFTAAASTTQIQLAVGTIGTALFKVSCKLAVPDRSYKSKGLIVNGTLMRAPVATGSDLYALSGWSNGSGGNFLYRPNDSDLNLATADWAFIVWSNDGGSATYSLMSYGPTGSLTGSSVGMEVWSGLARLWASDDSAATQDLASFSFAGQSGWRMWVGVRRGNTLELWMDGIRRATASIVNADQSLTNAAASIFLGKRSDNAPGLEHEGSLALSRVSVGYAPTPAQIARMYADESALFQPNAKAFLGGASNSVQSLALDEDAGLLHVGTGDGVSQFAGLRRVGRLTQAAGTAFTVPSVTSLSAGGGALLIGTASEAGVVTELMPVKDELRQASVVANSSDPVLTGVTTDATPLDLGKIFVGEGESVQIEADIMATEYGQTPTEGASYTVRARVRRNLGGNVQLVGSAYHVTVDETTATMDATIIVDTTAQAFAINVTGVASKRLIWRAVLRLNWISETRNAAA